ncbi:AbfB domain-containing protein [Nostoc sp. FACHB-110]|uniref:AbfB domain-containing protein n=1 Tax=Nostoc sp. FACHB-110 TaxID=2692834 RepID=UPI001685091D|nr:AbfB domain-containing protein [Nostoc sp. FACHB-110]MBD2438582.1 AbfB domain-containing protein [Nostoc sp. FACHB-110]
MAAIVALAIAVTHGVLYAQTPSAAPLGQWSAVDPWPVYGVHLTLMPDGNVLAWDSTNNGFGGATNKTILWNPTTNTKTELNSNPSLQGEELFCAPHTQLPDGKVFTVTGTVGVADSTTHIFDNQSNQWSLHPNMNTGRYYPSSTLLANGNILVTGGSYPIDADAPEIFESGTWRSLSSAKIPFALPKGFIDNTSYFPWTQVAPNGQIFYVGPESSLRYINPNGTGSITTVGERDGIFRDYGSYAMYSTGKFLVAGGGPAPKSTYTIDINGNQPVISRTGDLTYGRRQQNLTILADGQVLVTGGNSNPNGKDGQAGSQFDLNTAVYAGEIWNPATGQWKTLASMAKPRQYHSTGLLLPDGRVVVAGGVCGPCGATGHNEQNAEVFSPPYLFNLNGSLATRPTISSAPNSINYGQLFNVTSPEATSISKGHLIKLGAVTHATNFDQRLVPLSFSKSGTTITVTAPANANLAPPGYYMLFLVNSAGVPSVAKIIQVGGNPSPVPPPNVQVPLYRRQSIQAFNYPTYYVGETNALGYIKQVNANSTAVDKNSTTYKIVPGLANQQCISFESVSVAGTFLRHQGYRLKLNPNDNTDLFKADATFCPKAGLADTTAVSFASFNYPSYYLRHRNYELWIDPQGTDSIYKQDATFKFATPWTPGTDDLSGLQSLQSLNNLSYYIGQTNSLGYIQTVSSSSDTLTKNNATWNLVSGLANSNCISFESRTNAGYYLRHQAYRLKLNQNDNTDLFKADATFCPKAGLADTTAVSFTSFNYPTYYLRHRNYELWIDPQATDTVYKNDASFKIAVPWSQ